MTLFFWYPQNWSRFDLPPLPRHVAQRSLEHLVDLTIHWVKSYPQRLHGALRQRLPNPAVRRKPSGDLRWAIPS
jgi:hypothetical protein